MPSHNCRSAAQLCRLQPYHSQLCPLSFHRFLQLEPQQCQSHRVTHLPELRVQHSALTLPHAPILTPCQTFHNGKIRGMSLPPLLLLRTTQMDVSTRIPDMAQVLIFRARSLSAGGLTELFIRRLYYDFWDDRLDVISIV